MDYLDTIVSHGLDDKIGNDTQPGLYKDLEGHPVELDGVAYYKDKDFGVSLSFDPNTQKHHNWALHATDHLVKTVLQVACLTYPAAVLHGKNIDTFGQDGGKWFDLKGILEKPEICNHPLYF